MTYPGDEMRYPDEVPLSAGVNGADALVVLVEKVLAAPPWQCRTVPGSWQEAAIVLVKSVLAERDPGLVARTEVAAKEFAEAYRLERQAEYDARQAYGRTASEIQDGLPPGAGLFVRAK